MGTVGVPEARVLFQESDAGPRGRALTHAVRDAGRGSSWRARFCCVPWPAVAMPSGPAADETADPSIVCASDSRRKAMTAVW